MEIDVSVLTGGSIHIPHICRKEDPAKIEGAHLIIGLSGVMKEKTISGTDNANVK